MKRSTASVAASMLAIVVAVTLLWPGEPAPPPAAAPPAPPASLEDLPLGPATSMPWWQDGTLHVGATAIETPLDIVLFGNGTTVVGRARAEHGSAWSVVRGSSLEPLLTSADLVHPEVSDDGRTIVWADPVAPDRRRLVAYDVASGSVTGEIEVPVHVVCCDQGGELVVHGVLSDGRVIWSMGPSAAFAWRPGESEAVHLSLRERWIASESWPGGVMWQGGSRSIHRTPGVLATVSEAGVVRRVAKVPTDQLGQWSPDGSTYAYPGHTDRADDTDTGPIWLQDIATGDRRGLDLPTAPSFSLVAWESAHAVILETRLPYDRADRDSGLQALVRCDTGTGDCERVAGAPTGVPVLPYP